MIHIYDIEHLKGVGDVDVVTERLKSVDGVRTVAVSLENHTVTIDMDQHVNQEAFNKTLMGTGPWKLVNERMDRPEESKPSVLRKYLPFAVIVGIALLVGVYLASTKGFLK